MHNLLNSNGHLLLQEVSPSAKWTTAVFGILPDWSKGAEARVSFEPSVDSAAWVRGLSATGFKVDGISASSKLEGQLNTIAIAIARPEILAKTPSKKSLFLLRKALIPLRLEI